MPEDPELTPQEQQVRRLLADARHTEPMPDDVAARLDGVLADLGRDRPASQRPTGLPAAPPPADLAGARRRRTVRNLLVAAAAVVAVGVGLNEADLTVSGDAEDSAPAATSGDAGAGADSGAGSAERSAATGEAEQPGQPAPDLAGGTDSFLRDQAPVRLTSERFGPQVRRLQDPRRAAAAYGTTTSQSDAKPERHELDALRASCSTDGWGAGRRVAVRYDGDLGALVFRRAHGETQVVDLYLCGSDQPARSITLPAR